MKENFNSFEEAFGNTPHRIHYALKANSNLAIVKAFSKLGGGADVVSGGELTKALHAGLEPERIVFAGVGKSSREIKMGLRENILSFNVESTAEIKLISKLAQKMGKIAPVAVRINPDIDPNTHPYITTGLKQSKFGISSKKGLEAYRFIKDHNWLSAKGIHTHIGSQITETAPFEEVAEFISDFVKTLCSEGTDLEFVDFGGGFGIPNKQPKEAPQRKNFIKSMINKLEPDLKVMVEPGRSLVGDAGLLLTKLIRTKENRGKRFTIVDAGMNDFLRPTLYDAYHEIIPVKEFSGKKAETSVVGPVCESGDFLGKNRHLPLGLTEGDFLAVLNAGAYGYSMASNYNSRPRPPEVLIKGDNFEVIRDREDLAEITSKEAMPEFPYTM